MVAKKTTKKTTTKKTTTKATGGFKPNLEQLRGAIFKRTGKKPAKPTFSQLPHVPSGSFLINDLIGGNLAADGKAAVCPGYPRKKYTEIYGEEASGKTTAALQAIVEVQKHGVAMFLDFEHALHHGYAKNMGVNFHPDKLMLYEPNTLEEGLKIIYGGILAGIDIIVCDSVASMVPEKELQKDISDEAKIGALPKKMSETLPKVVGWLSNPPKGSEGTALILLNQIRATINTSGPMAGKGAPKNTSGGKALKFYAYLRLFFKRTGSEFIKRKDKFTGKERTIPYGNHTEVRVIKSKVDAKEGSKTDIFIRFGKGIDDILSLIVAGIQNKLIKKEGTWLSYDGNRHQGKEKFRQYLVENPKAMAKLRKQVLEHVRMGADDMVNEVEEEDELVEQMSALGGETFEDTDDDEPEETELEGVEAEGIEEIAVDDDAREEVQEAEGA